MLTFDEAAHMYHWDGKPVPNVTRIIAPLTDYSHIPAEALERARQQGQHVHKMVELDCKNDLDFANLPEWMRGHYAAWRLFVDETGFQCFSSEHKVYHPRLGYAGTLDLAGLMPKLKTSKKPAVIDVKRSFYAGPAIGLQTVAYAEAWNLSRAAGLAENPKLEERYALQLNANGTYRLQPFVDRDDSAAFLACLQQLRWKEKHYGHR
jgi:hypothetical protein